MLAGLNIYAMIFAAGLGTRLKPLTDTMPKALVPLNGHTLLEYQILKLKKAGVTDIIINVHHFANQIIDYLHAHNCFGCNIIISDESDHLLDTGGGLRRALHLLSEQASSQSLRLPDYILALNADILSNISVMDFVAAACRNTIGTLVVSERQTQRYLCFDNTNQLCGWTNVSTGEFRPASLADIPPEQYTKLAFSGMQLLHYDVLQYLDNYSNEKGGVDKFSLIDFYLYMVGKRTLYSYIPHDYRMMDVGKIEHLAEAEAFAASLALD